MKQALLVILILLLAVPAIAHPRVVNNYNNTTVEAKDNHNTGSIGIDAPNIVRFTENTTLGVEAKKDVIRNIFGDSWSWYEDDRGYSIMAKITWTGTFFDFSRK